MKDIKDKVEEAIENNIMNLNEEDVSVRRL